MDYIGTAPVTELGMQRPCDAYGVVAKDRITQPYCPSVFGKYWIHCPTVPHHNYSKGLPQRQHVQCGD